MLDYSKIPVPHMVEDMQRYMEHGIPGGNFMMALLECDFIEMCRRADDDNRTALWQWACWLYNEAPAASFGSRTLVDEWMHSHRELRDDLCAAHADPRVDLRDHPAVDR